MMRPDKDRYQRMDKKKSSKQRSKSPRPPRSSPAKWESKAKQSIIEPTANNNDSFYKQGAVREIGVFFEIFRISDINTANSTFDAQFELQFTWLPSEADVTAFRADAANYEPSFVPKFNWTNALDVELEMDATAYQIFRDGGLDTWGNTVTLPEGVSMANAVLFAGKGTFFVTFMNLRNFPFDVLDLPIELEAQQNADAVVFVPSLDVGSEVVDVTKGCKLLNPAFKLHEPLAETVVKSDNGAEYSSFVVRLKFERRWNAHSGMFITMFALCLCSLAVFTQEFGDRIENLFTILLTVVAYQYVIQAEIPKIPYYTKADIYVLMCFLFVTVIVAETAVLSEIDPDNEQGWDFLAMVVIIAVFALANLVYLVSICAAKSSEMRKLRWFHRHYDCSRQRPEIAVDMLIVSL